MANRTQQRKADARAAVDARRLTPGKVGRLVLKTLAFALLVSLLITLLGALGVPALENRWLQFGLMLLVYAAAYPFLMSEFRPNRNAERSGR